MKAITKRFLAVFLSLMIVIAPTIQQANAAGDWTPTGTTSVGARTIVSATSGGYKAAVNLAPMPIRVVAQLLKVSNTAALVYAAMQIADGGIDFVLDPANNRVKYKRTSMGIWHVDNPPLRSTSLSAMCSMLAASAGFTVTPDRPPEVIMIGSTPLGTCHLTDPATGQSNPYSVSWIVDQPQEDYIPLPEVAKQVIKNAANNHTLSQEVVAAAAAASVAAGDWDKDLMSGAVPITDTRPPIPVVPGSQTGDSNEGVQGATPGEQAEQARLEAERQKKQAAAAAEAAKAAAEAARKAADEARDLINQAVDEAIKEAAKAAAEAAKAAAEQAKAVADRAAAEAAQAAKDAAKAADKAVNDVKAAAAAAAKELADAIASGDAARVAAAEAAKAAAEAALADAKAKQEAAEKEAAKAKEEAAKPFELPAFCSWAAIVCETAEWLKREPETPEITAIDTDSPIDDFDSDKSYITFTGSCPPKYTASLSIMGATAPFEFDYTPVCTVMSYLKPFIVGAGYIAAAYIIAGHSRGSKD